MNKLTVILSEAIWHKYVHICPTYHPIGNGSEPRCAAKRTYLSNVGVQTRNVRVQRRSRATTEIG